MSSSSNADQRGRCKNKHYWTPTKDSVLIECLLDWDNEHSILLCEKSAFDEYVKKRKDASGLYGKLFPYYNKLAEIYGRDRATGTNASNVDDDEEEMRQNDAIGVEFGVDDNIDGGEDDEEIDEFDGVSHTQQPTNMRRRSIEITNNVVRIKKTKVLDEISTNVGALADSISNIVPKIQGLIDAISDKDVAEMQTNLFTEISKIYGLTPMECIQATNILAKAPPLMRVYYAISDEMKLLYILNMVFKNFTINIFHEEILIKLSTEIKLNGPVLKLPKSDGLKPPCPSLEIP
ncbi:hypothetical protein G4B88_002484 [Cannabis sativa]|uniref:Uncharacterized protein n=1 Tax=Cannabis sativa TaxID=3483 RepID=A0A7J6I988_CANSA|nr:hypothetical protein G4B88_002484 [Cannabis sativa]